MKDENESLPEFAEIWQATLGWQPDKQQQQQFQRLYTAILAGNQQLNLTRITEPQEFWEKHLWDSLSAVKGFLPGSQESGVGSQESGVGSRESGVRSQDLGGQELEDKASEDNLKENPASFDDPTNDPDSSLRPPPSSLPKVLDIGTGAGFPGIPVAIALPSYHLTLLDSTRKKMTFLDALIQELGISNAKTLTDRVEAVGQNRQHRERYDVVLVRAVAAAAVCAEYALPLLQVGGVAIAYRGQWTDEEAVGLERAIAQLGGTLETVESFETPLTKGIRHCLYIRKTKPTDPQFPRAIGVPTQKPLE